MMSSRVVERSPRVPFPAVSLGCGRHEPAKRPGPRSGRCDRARWGCGRRGPQPRSAANAATPCEEGVRPAATRRGTRPLTGSPSGLDRSNQRATPGMVVVFAHAIKDIGHCKRSRQTRPSAETTTDLARRLSSFNRSLISRRLRRRRLHCAAHPPCVAASLDGDLRNTNLALTIIARFWRMARRGARVPTTMCAAIVDDSASRRRFAPHVCCQPIKLDGQVRRANMILRDAYPKAWEALNGRTLSRGSLKPRIVTGSTATAPAVGWPSRQFTQSTSQTTPSASPHSGQTDTGKFWRGARTATLPRRWRVL